MKLRNILLAGLSAGILAVGINTVLPVQAQPKPANVSQASDKDPTPPNPNRPYFDMWGNKFTYDGQLITAACPNVPDPITHQDNPKCVCPAPTETGTYFLQGYDKTTGAAVCGFSYYHECPYARSQSADSDVCQKLSAEQDQPVTETSDNQYGGMK